MSELAASIPAEDLDETRPETRRLRVTKSGVFLGSMVLGAVGGYIEWKMGYDIRNWPPPSHSLKHLPIGTSAAAAWDMIRKKTTKRASAVETAVVTAAVNSAAESIQGEVLDRGQPADWLTSGHLDNTSDFLTSQVSAQAYRLASDDVLTTWLNTSVDHYGRKIGGKAVSLAKKLNPSKDSN